MVTRKTIFSGPVIFGIIFLLGHSDNGRAQVIYHRNEIPVLCYHNIRFSSARHLPEYTISISRLEEHLKMLADSGYSSVLPDQVLEHMTIGIRLPARAVMITFDDAHEEHFTVAAPLLQRYGFRGVFFVLVVSIDKKGYLSQQQIKTLTDSGHVIGGHTHDHPDLRKITGAQWFRQINVPNTRLEQITGKKVDYFAYPYGAWNDTVISELKQRNIKAAFQLGGKQNAEAPQYTIGRLLVSGDWTSRQLFRRLNRRR